MGRTDFAGGLRSDIPRQHQAKAKSWKSMVEFTYDGPYEAIIADNPWIAKNKDGFKFE